MKKCKLGYYYCYTDKKCKKIPVGYRRGLGGYLRKETEEEKRMETGTVTDTMAQMGVMGMVLEMVTVSLVVVVVVMAQGE